MQKEQERIENENRVAEENRRMKNLRKQRTLSVITLQDEEDGVFRQTEDESIDDNLAATQPKDGEGDKGIHEYNSERERLAQERELTKIV